MRLHRGGTWASDTIEGREDGQTFNCKKSPACLKGRTTTSTTSSKRGRERETNIKLQAPMKRKSNCRTYTCKWLPPWLLTYIYVKAVDRNTRSSSSLGKENVRTWASLFIPFIPTLKACRKPLFLYHMMRVSIIERALNKCFLMLAKMDDMEMYNLYYMYEIASYTCKWLSLLIFMLGGDTELFLSGTRQTSSPVLHFSSGWSLLGREVVLCCHHITTATLVF